MLNYEVIGQRIKEQRKYIHKISQEKMAEDLFMYQADISNLEKGKLGSGISDLNKLQLIAEYFDISLETLLFGREDKNMITYHGDKLKLKKSKKRMPGTHGKTLSLLTGQAELENLQIIQYECGPYILYTITEKLMSIGSMQNIRDNFAINKYHTFVFLGTEIVAVMAADYTTIMDHIFQPSLKKLQTLIPHDILDVTDVIRTLNPYWAFWQFAEDEEKESFLKPMLDRMDVLRSAGEDKPVLYVESVYVKEDSRNHGLFRMYIDLLKLLFKDCLIWLNMEPTSGAELDRELDYIPSYTVSELGQLHINAAIAEKVGFTVDSDTWHRQAEVLNEDGSITVEPVLVRKCAFYLPSHIKDIVKGEADLVLQGRAMQRMRREHSDGSMLDLKHGYVDGKFATELKVQKQKGESYYSTVILAKDEIRYIISYSSLLVDKTPRIVVEYQSLADVEQTEYFDNLKMAESMAKIAIESNPEKFEDLVDQLEVIEVWTIVKPVDTFS